MPGLPRYRAAMRIRRFLLAAAVLSAPAYVATATPAQATCRPEKPSTCQIECPSGWQRASVAGKSACVPDLNRAEPPIQ